MKQIKMLSKRNLSVAVFAAALLALTSCFDFSNELVVEGENGGNSGGGKTYTVTYHFGSNYTFNDFKLVLSNAQPVLGNEHAATIEMYAGDMLTYSKLPHITFTYPAANPRFEGWLYNGSNALGVVVNSNLDVHAKWAKAVKIIYNKNQTGQSAYPAWISGKDDKVEVDPNNMTTITYIPLHEGDQYSTNGLARYDTDRTKEYKFDCWTYKGNSNNDIDVKPNELLTLGDTDFNIYAKWEKGYKIEYKDKDGGGHAATDKLVALNDSLTTYYFKDDEIYKGSIEPNVAAGSTEPHKYFDFKDWTNKSGGDITYPIKADGTQETLTLYASWKEQELPTLSYKHPAGGKSKVMYTAGKYPEVDNTPKWSDGSSADSYTYRAPDAAQYGLTIDGDGKIKVVDSTTFDNKSTDGTDDFSVKIYAKRRNPEPTKPDPYTEETDVTVTMKVRPAFSSANFLAGKILYEVVGDLYDYCPRDTDLFPQGSGFSFAVGNGETLNPDEDMTIAADITIESGGEITATNNHNVSLDGIVNIDDGDLKAEGGFLNVNGKVTVTNGGEIEINNGVINANNTITVNNGEIKIENNGALNVNSDIILNYGSTLNVTNGNLNFGPSGKIRLVGGTMNITNGTPVSFGGNNLTGMTDGSAPTKGKIVVGKDSGTAQSIVYIPRDLNLSGVFLNITKNGTLTINSGKTLTLSGDTGVTQPTNDAPIADTICEGTINVNGILNVEANPPNSPKPPLVISGNGELIFNSGSSAILDAVTLQDTAKVTGGTDIVDETLQKKITSEINSAGGLYEFIKMVNNKQYYSINGRLTDNVACNSSVNANLPIGEDGKPYKGTFDGGGKTLSSMAKDYNGSDIIRGVGLFAETSSTATIENITVECNISGNCYYAGGIVGMNEGTIRNCTAKGTITANSYVGGIAGSNLSSSSSTPIIDGCVNQATVTSTGIELMSSNIPYQSQAGGITAQNTGVIRNCYNRGEIKGANSMVANASIWAGGIAASHGNKTNGAVENCYNVGKVTASTGASASQALAGGICGEATADISACHNIGTISATGPTNSFVGGIAGAAGRAQLTNNPATYALTCKFDCCFVLYGIAVAGASINGEAANIVNSDSVQGNQFGNQSGVGTVVNKLNAWRGANGDYKSWKIGVVSGVFINGVNQYPVLDGMP